MRRRTFDTLMSMGGVVLTIVLLVAGLLAFWGYSFANTNVHDQLAQQKIFFPAKGSSALAEPEINKYVGKYAGQQLLTGAQAEAYADHFIGVHVKGIAGGLTYSEVSTKLQALRASNPNSPDIATLQGQQDTLFKGETLRGLLLQAYAFWKMGQLAKLGMFAAFGLAIIMLVLTVLGFWHRTKVSPEEEILTPVEVGRKTA